MKRFGSWTGFAYLSSSLYWFNTDISTRYCHNKKTHKKQPTKKKPQKNQPKTTHQQTSKQTKNPKLGVCIAK